MPNILKSRMNIKLKKLIQSGTVKQYSDIELYIALEDYYLRCQQYPNTYLRSSPSLKGRTSWKDFAYKCRPRSPSYHQIIQTRSWHFHEVRVLVHVIDSDNAKICCTQIQLGTQHILHFSFLQRYTSPNLLVDQ